MEQHGNGLFHTDALERNNPVFGLATSRPGSDMSSNGKGDVARISLLIIMLRKQNTPPWVRK